MSKLPNFKLFKECPGCYSWAFGKRDTFCSSCGGRLKDAEVHLAGIRDYSSSLLIEYLTHCKETAKVINIHDVPILATKSIKEQGYVEFSTYATRQILAECWNEVEIALDYWRAKTGLDFHITNVENLHIFCIVSFAEIVWQRATDGIKALHLTDETIVQAIGNIKSL